MAVAVLVVEVALKEAVVVLEVDTPFEERSIFA